MSSSAVSISRDMTVPSYLHRIRTCSSAFLQYERLNRTLEVWYWPVNEARERIPLSDLEDHRVSHSLKGPYCLCPLIGRFDGSDPDSKASISLRTTGRFSGQYVTSCKHDRCGYFVPIERFYTNRGLPVRLYPLRDQDEISIQPRAQPPTVTALLLQMDSHSSPGLSDHQLEKLLVRTSSDGHIASLYLDGGQMFQPEGGTGDTGIEHELFNNQEVYTVVYSYELLRYLSMSFTLVIRGLRDLVIRKRDQPGLSFAGGVSSHWQWNHVRVNVGANGRLAASRP
ncbi:hypothetical protein BV25DRAFT_1842988 [Artomyces pyxidatus]|uniref:Uncharacterized protein n=1 Tax=Artomyces pyxidatus TaxID=48021 RepID=A0ACB8SGL9_9AGAM|nr:hypothetical protein BV25DRAFT_1842988 [Artomyces pyxidatus]